MRHVRSVVLLTALLAACGHEALPVLYSVPAARLIDDRGRPLALDSLHGKVVVYDFIFTRCGGSCPLVTRKMQELVGSMKDPGLVFLSVTMDPTHDRPDVLSRYAARVRHDERWLFATGEAEAIRSLSVDGFKLAAGQNVSSTAEPILHSTKFVLADKQGRIRAYYDSGSRESLEKLRDDAEELLEE